MAGVFIATRDIPHRRKVVASPATRPLKSGKLIFSRALSGRRRRGICDFCLGFWFRSTGVSCCSSHPPSVGGGRMTRLASGLRRRELIGRIIRHRWARTHAPGFSPRAGVSGCVPPLVEVHTVSKGCMPAVE